MKRLLSFILFLTMLPPLVAQTAVQVNPNTRYQQIEGWGGSLCWWATISGGWSEAKVNEICTWITNPNELNMNIFRFNIGGGDAPGHNHMRKDGGAVPGYKTSESAAYDWSRDANQRKILLKLKSLRSDAIFEGFSNSPPYWMTKSGCASGNTDGSDNLKDDYYDDFATYLTDVAKFYKDTHGVTFRTLTPFNEPFSGWWKANSGQEGCKFSQGNQEKMIRELYAKLNSKGMLSYCTISAMDANSLDQAYNGVNGYIAAGDIVSKISQVNAHSYSGSNRTGLYNVTKAQGKRLWQSESGPLSVSATGITNYLIMAQRVITDLRDLKPVAWIDWQLMAENDPKWGLIPGDYANQTYRKDKSYYFRMQCSRFIKQGYTIIYSGDSRTVAAVNPANNELVLAIVNEATAATSFNIDLSLFGSTGSSATVYRTTSSENCAKLANLTIANKRIGYSAPAQSVTTFIIPIGTTPSTGIVSGATYTLTARHSGKLLEVGGGSSSNGAFVQQWRSNGGANQQWVLTDVGGGYYSMINKNSGKAMDVPAGSVVNGTRIIQYTYGGGTNQQWQLRDVGSGYYSITNRKSVKALDIANATRLDGDSIIQWTYGGGTNQQFLLTRINATAKVADLESEVSQSEGLSQAVLFPNPVSDQLTIHLKAGFDKGASIQLYNHSGKLVLSQETTGREHRLDLRNVPAGIYFVKIHTPQRSITRKITKQ